MNDHQGHDPMEPAQREILRTRARRLAREQETAAVLPPGLEVLEFVLAYENYAFETAYVREVCPLHALTHVPCTPPYVCGIINLRGQILAVLDVKRLFGLPDKGLVDRHHVVVLRRDQEDLGILVDAICGVHSVPLSAIQPALPTLSGLQTGYIRGVTSQRLVILDALKLLSEQRLVVFDEANS